MPRKSTIFKVCQKCGKEKSLSDYHRNKIKSDGHNGICKDCQKEVTRGSDVGCRKKPPKPTYPFPIFGYNY